MTKKHVTALGKQLDMAALRSKYELTRAVGNMNVNARGDTLNSNNQIIQDSTKRVNNMYKKTIGNTFPTQGNPVTKNLNEQELTAQELSDLENDEPNPVKDKKQK